MNRIQLQGRVGQDPEFKPFKAKEDAAEGTAVKGFWTFSLATSKKLKNYDDNETQWHRVRVLGAEDMPVYAKKLITKGTLIRLEGSIEMFKKEDKSYLTNIFVDEANQSIIQYPKDREGASE
ncbi:hypothetical protein HK101_008327 [Irineochytrium annulatum]|nr:hypothetical protein HK101_008327 [Irineochytrium annulatum]